MDWLQLLIDPTVIVAALIIGSVGEVMKKLVKAKAGDTGWRGIFYITLPMHAVVVGCLLGLIPFLPPVDILVKPGYEHAARVMTYGMAGVVSKVGYDVIIGVMKRALNNPTARENLGAPPVDEPVVEPTYREPAAPALKCVACGKDVVDEDVTATGQE